MASQSLGVRIPDKLLNGIDDFREKHSLGSRTEAIVELIEAGLNETACIGTTYTSQDQTSGARANHWGRDTAQKIGQILGAKSISNKSNEFDLDGNRITIRCAKSRTNRVGLYNTMRDRVTFVIGAFQTDEGYFHLLRITPSEWKTHAHGASPSNPNIGRISFVSRSTFHQIGEDLGEVDIEDDDH